MRIVRSARLEAENNDYVLYDDGVGSGVWLEHGKLLVYIHCKDERHVSVEIVRVAQSGDHIPLASAQGRLDEED